MAKNKPNAETADVTTADKKANGSTAPVVPGVTDEAGSQGGNGASQLGDSGDAPTQDEIEAKAKADAEAAEQARIQQEQHDKNAAAEAKRARLAEETAAEKAKLRQEQKANSIPDAAPAALVAVDPFTVPLGDLSDDELSDQWDALASVEEDLVAENAKREAELKKHEQIRQQLRLEANQIEREWNEYQKRHNHVLLPRRDAIRKEAQRREMAAAQAAADAAAAKAVAVGS